MFSIFKKKKDTPSPPPEDEGPPIPGPDTDSFVVIDKKEDDPPQGSSTGLPYPPMPYPPAGGFGSTSTAHKKEIGFLQGVPFKLSKEFNGDTSNEIIGIQISEIMAHRAQRLQLHGTDYDFSVERSVLAES